MDKPKSLETLDLTSITSPTQTISQLNHLTNPLEPIPEIDETLEVETVLGKGGMGVVYLGKQKHPLRDVAIKKAYENRLDLSRALYQEAMITGSLEHPNIVPIHLMNLEDSKAPEVVMKRVIGENLSGFDSSSISDPEQLRQVIGWIIQVCNALEYAHERRIIHRDIKPENIMVGNYGEVYLLDWGIALELDKADSLPVGLMGTPAYMAPEMLSGNPKDISIQTDVYLVGATLHELLTGSTRHSGTDLLGTLFQAEQSLPYDYSEKIPYEIADICNKACHVDRLKRFESIQDLKQSLLVFLEHRDADKMSRAAMNELEQMQRYIGHYEAFRREVLIVEHFSNARFAFHYALSIDPNHIPAKQGLKMLQECMVRYHLDQNELVHAEALLQNMEYNTELDARFKEVQAAHKQEQKELERLVRLGQDIDPNRSKRIRLSMMIITGCLGLFLASVIVIYKMEKFVITNEELVIQGVVVLIPMVLFVFFARSELQKRSLSRQAAVGIIGSALGLVLVRTSGLLIDANPQHVLIFEKFVIALGLANTPPALPSGIKVAIVFVCMGLFGVFVPEHHWIAHLVSVLVLVYFLMVDFFFVFMLNKGTD